MRPATDRLREAALRLAEVPVMTDEISCFITAEAERLEQLAALATTTRVPLARFVWCDRRPRPA